MFDYLNVLKGKVTLKLLLLTHKVFNEQKHLSPRLFEQIKMLVLNRL